jgi:hypothetical protein
VIRRGFWLVVGAAGGIMGYRRAAAATRQVAATFGTRPRKPGAARRHWARETIRFARDVREGMDQYYVHRAAAQPPRLGASNSNSDSKSTVHDEREDH